MKAGVAGIGITIAIRVNGMGIGAGHTGDCDHILSYIKHCTDRYVFFHFTVDFDAILVSEL